MKQTPPSRESWVARLRANADRANAERGAKPRNRALVMLDVVVAVLLVLLDLGIAILVAGSATQYAGIRVECSADQLVGLACNRTVLDIVSVALIAVAILGFVLAAGMVLVNIIRRRWTFWWPMAAGIVMVGLFWLGTWLVSLTLPSGPAS
jgi:uncharacterized protein DUF6264